MLIERGVAPISGENVATNSLSLETVAKGVAVELLTNAIYKYFDGNVPKMLIRPAVVAAMAFATEIDLDTVKGILGVLGQPERAATQIWKFLVDHWPDTPEDDPEEGGDDDTECSTCDGTGEVDCDVCDEDGDVPCEACDGTGGEECPECDENGLVPCEACGQTGEVKCGYCKGKGCGRCDDTGWRQCTPCDGDGWVYCETCDEDCEVGCADCDGTGFVPCDECDEYCQVACPDCQ